MKNLLLATFCMLTLLAAGPAAANEKPDIPKINLTVSASENVEQDTLQAVLAYEARNVTASAAQEEVNQNIARALQMLGNDKDVRIVTGSYHTYEDRRERTWYAAQTLTLESKKADKVLEQAGNLQKNGFKINSLSYFLSYEAQARMTNQLIAKALATAKERADMIVKETGLRGARLHAIRHMDGGGYAPPQPYMMRTMAMDAGAEMAAKAVPSARPDETRVMVHLEVEYRIVD